ncbi:MAG: hypothetical protein Q8K92_26440 [Leadbetterella sp.]|nr:hypothetical protein [Leadbetterella sp.]
MKLLTLLKSLQPDEHKEFEKFLQSPFFKASDQYLKFFQYLSKRYPGFELDKEALQLAYRRCFGPDSLTDSKLYNLLSGLSKQVEKFIVASMVFHSGNQGPSLYDQLLAKSLGMRNMGAYFRAESQRLIEETVDRPVKEIEHYLALHQLHEQVYYNPDTPKFSEHPPHLQQAVDLIDLYYCITKLRLSTEMKARERILKVRYEMPMLDAVLARTAAPELLDAHPLLAVYHSLAMLYLNGVEEQGFRDLMQIFNSKIPYLPKTDRTFLLRHLINCGISLNTRDVAVEPELLSLYKLAIDSEILLEGNRITDSSFINIVNLASICKEFDWAKAFIDQFSPCLEENKRQPSIDLAMAGLYYSEGKLDEAQQCLGSAIFQIPSFELLARALLLKIVFDRYLNFGKDYEFLIAQLKAFERYIQIKQITIEKKDACLNWTRFLRKLALVKFEMVVVPMPQKELLRKKLRQAQPIISKKWLELKIDML